MSIKDGRDYLLLVWKEPKSRRRYVVASLSRNGQFEFSYSDEVQAAIEAGFEPLIAFPDLKKTYKSDKLFSAFCSRLPDPKRKGIEKILQKYGLNSYDAYQLLKSSGARLPIDKLEFVDPIFDFETDQFTRKFFLAGPRHYLGCQGEECAKATDVEINEELKLVPEPENQYDSNAVKIANLAGELLGYLPRYYAAGISELIELGKKISCKVIEINKEDNCDECIKVEMVLVK